MAKYSFEIIFSQIIASGERREIGLYEFTIFLSPFLNIGVIYAYFQESGKTPSTKHLLYIIEMG